MKPIVVDGEIEIFAFISKIIEKTYCPLSIHAIKELIIKKFEHFNINAEFYNTDNTQIEKYQGKKPWEKDELNEEMDIDKERKRVKTIHKAIRKGIVNFDGNRYRYELPEEYTFHVVDEPHLLLTSINFTFYNKDLSKDNGGGHGLPLKIWRMEEGKDVYLNKILSPQDVGDISYNDEYGINTKTGVEYVNVKNKVRNKYRDFNINAIMTTPSDTVMVNEEINKSDKDRILKKGMTVNTALRKGNLVIKYDHNEVEKNTKYRYELPERCNVTMRGESLRISYRYDEGIKNIGDKFPLKIWTDVKGKEILLNTQMTNHDYDYIEDDMENTMLSYIFVKVMKNVKKRYEHFNIQLDLNPYSSSTPLFLHEEEEDNIKKQIKKAKTIYKALKKGTIGGDDPEQPHFFYELSDDFTVHTTQSGVFISSEKIKIKHLNRGCLLHSTDYMGSLIRKRFNLFGIILTNPYKDLYFDYEVDAWERPLNEGAEVIDSEGLTKNEVRKAKTLYKLLKKGHFKYDDERSTYGYILPENYYIYKDELGDVCIKLTGDEETKMISKVKMSRPSDNFDLPILPEYESLHHWIKAKVREKFDGFNIKFIF